MRISDSKFGALVSIPGLILLIIWVLVPSAYLFAISFLRYHPPYPVTGGGMENYGFVFGDRVFWLSLKHAIIFCGGSTALTLTVGLILAHSLSRITRGSTLFRSLTILPWAVPLILSGFIWAWMFNPAYGIISDALMKTGLMSEPLKLLSDPKLAMLGVIIADAWTRIPFMTLLLLAGLQSIPEEIYDATKVDGADTLYVFRHISMPMNKYHILVGTFITAMFSFRTIDAIASMTVWGGPGRATYVYGMYIVDNIYFYNNFGVAAASGVLMFVILAGLGSLFLYFLIRRR